MALRASQHGDLHLCLHGFQEKLCTSLHSLWTNSDLCDLTFQASGGWVHAHSCVVATFSSTIAQTLSTLDQAHRNEERSQKFVTVVVDHVSVEVMRSIISFIYTGRLVTPSKHTKDLLNASKWLKIQDLVSLLEESITERKHRNTVLHSNRREMKQIRQRNQDTSPSGSSEYTSATTNSQNTNTVQENTTIPKDLSHQSLSPTTYSSLPQNSTLPHGLTAVTTQASQQASHISTTTSTSSVTTTHIQSSSVSLPSGHSLTRDTNKEQHPDNRHSISNQSQNRLESHQASFPTGKLISPCEDSCSSFTPQSAPTESNSHITHTTASVQSTSVSKPPGHSSTKDADDEPCHGLQSNNTSPNQTESQTGSYQVSPSNSTTELVALLPGQTFLKDTHDSSSLPKKTVLNVDIDVTPTSEQSPGGASVAQLSLPTFSVPGVKDKDSTKAESDTPCRRGKRQRKKTKKLTESYLFASDSNKPYEVDDFKDSSVSTIKVEVDDLLSFMPSVDELNFLHQDSGCISVSEQVDDIMVGGVNSCVLDELTEIKQEVIDDDPVKSLFNTNTSTHNCESIGQMSPEVNNVPRQMDPVVSMLNGDSDHSVKDHQSSPAMEMAHAPQSHQASATTGTENAILDPLSLGTNGTLTVTSLGSDTDTAKVNGDGSSKTHVEQAMNVNTKKITKPSRSVLNPYKCPECFKRFDDVEKYNAHVSDHPKFYCAECCLTFKARPSLTCHQLHIHGRNSHLVCRECSFRASTTLELRAHSNQEHKQPKPFVCNHPGCSYRAVKHYNLLRHIRFKHATAQEAVVCHKCGTTFSHDTRLQSHLKSCFRKEEHLCELCGEGFNRKESLNEHKNVVHYKIKKHKCEHCFKLFGHPANLRRHMLIHSNAYPYSCPACPKKFRHSNSLKGHLEIHQKDGVTVENPYESRQTNYKHK